MEPTDRFAHIIGLYKHDPTYLRSIAMNVVSAARDAGFITPIYMHAYFRIQFGSTFASFSAGGLCGRDATIYSNIYICMSEITSEYLVRYKH